METDTMGSTVSHPTTARNDQTMMPKFAKGEEVEFYDKPFGKWIGATIISDFVYPETCADGSVVFDQPSYHIRFERDGVTVEKDTDQDRIRRKGSSTPPPSHAVSREEPSLIEEDLEVVEGGDECPADSKAGKAVSFELDDGKLPAVERTGNVAAATSVEDDDLEVVECGDECPADSKAGKSVSFELDDRKLPAVECTGNASNAKTTTVPRVSYKTLRTEAQMKLIKDLCLAYSMGDHELCKNILVKNVHLGTLLPTMVELEQGLFRVDENGTVVHKVDKNKPEKFMLTKKDLLRVAKTLFVRGLRTKQGMRDHLRGGYCVSADPFLAKNWDYISSQKVLPDEEAPVIPATQRSGSERTVAPTASAPEPPVDTAPASPKSKPSKAEPAVAAPAPPTPPREQTFSSEATLVLVRTVEKQQDTITKAFAMMSHADDRHAEAMRLHREDTTTWGNRLDEQHRRLDEQHRRLDEQHRDGKAERERSAAQVEKLVNTFTTALLTAHRRNHSPGVDLSGVSVQLDERLVTTPGASGAPRDRPPAPAGWVVPTTARGTLCLKCTKAGYPCCPKHGRP